MLRRRQVTHPMDVRYEVMRATDPIERMMLKAIAEPILMQCKTHAQSAETMIAFTGTRWPVGTRPIHVEKGSPRSRANANICRLAPAMLVMLLTMLRMIKRDDRPLALRVEPVAL